MITTVFKVKLIANKQDGISSTEPDASFDSDAGYHVGFNLLVTDGTSWVCDDDTVGAAVWTQDVTDDDQIKEVIRKVTDLLPRYCFQSWADVRYRIWETQLIFSGNSITKDGTNFDEYFFENDTLWIEHSRRNDGAYNVTAVDTDSISVDPPVNVDMTESANVLLYAAVYPVGLRDIAARMCWYDVYVRPTRSAGVTSENIGSYSYSKDVDIGGVDYPADVATGLAQYKRPKVL